MEWYRRLKKPKDADKEEMKDSKAVRLQAKLGVGPFWTPLYGAPPAPRALTQVCVHVCLFSVYLGLTQYVCGSYASRRCPLQVIGEGFIDARDEMNHHPEAASAYRCGLL